MLSASSSLRNGGLFSSIVCSLYLLFPSFILIYLGIVTLEVSIIQDSGRKCGEDRDYKLKILIRIRIRIPRNPGQRGDLNENLKPQHFPSGTTKYLRERVPGQRDCIWKFRHLRYFCLTGLLDSGVQMELKGLTAPALTGIQCAEPDCDVFSQATIPRKG